VIKNFEHFAPKTLKEALALQFKSFGGEGFKALAEVLEKETKVKD
jgi:hypothetical protein